MKIYDNCNLFSELLVAMEISKKEKCALSVGSVDASSNGYSCIIEDYCFSDSVGGESDAYFSTVPCEFSFALLSLCKKTGKTPIIIHTHPKMKLDENVRFSCQDVRFMKSFAAVAKKQDIRKSLFIVTDGIGLEFCMVDGTDEAYIYERGVLDEELKHK